MSVPCIIKVIIIRSFLFKIFSCGKLWITGIELPLISTIVNNSFGAWLLPIEFKKINGCRIVVESPQRSEDLKRIAGTKADKIENADGPKK